MYFEALDASLTRGWAPLRGIVQGGWKYIDLPDAELYDLGADPGEQHNRIDRDPHADPLKRALRLVSRPETAAPRVGAGDRGRGTPAIARLHRRQLVAQGPRTAADDPKRLVALNERFNTALTAFDEGRSQEALSAFMAILRERPDFVAARTSAATALLAAGRSREAVALLRDGLQDQQRLSGVARQAGQRASGPPATCAERRRRSNSAPRAGDENPDVLNDLAVVYASLGRTDDARSGIQRADRAQSRGGDHLVQPRDSSSSRIGGATRRSRRCGARPESTRRTAMRGMRSGAALVDGDTPGAIDAWRRAERLLPRELRSAVQSGNAPRRQPHTVRRDSLSAALRARGAARPLRERHRRVCNRRWRAGRPVR